MEANICCAYNVSRSCNVSSKVTVADRTDQPLTILRLLVEGLGFKAATGLWLNPLHGAPQLVRPFPFDLVYLDANMRVIEAVELLPEVPFPPFDDRATSALILPVRTISSTGIQRNDELAICSKEELENRIGIGTEESALLAVSSASASAAVSGRPKTAVATMDSPPVPDAIEVSSPVEVGSSTPVVPPPVFLPTRASTAMPIAGFTAAITTTWQVAGSTMAVMPDSDAVASLEPEASEVQAEIPPFEDCFVADEIASARLDSIEPEKEEEDERPAILDQPATASISVEVQAQAVDEEGGRPQTTLVAGEERPASATAKSEAREWIAVPSFAPEMVPVLVVYIPWSTTVSIQKPTGPLR
jgi:uncharacterized small protein (DUF1192 family)